jgi:hypothetical protein
MPLPPAWRIRGNTALSGFGITIYTYEPYILGNGTFINIMGQGSLANTPIAGFPYVPRPEDNFPQVNNGVIQQLAGVG